LFPLDFQEVSLVFPSSVAAAIRVLEMIH